MPDTLVTTAQVWNHKKLNAQFFGSLEPTAQLRKQFTCHASLHILEIIINSLLVGESYHLITSLRFKI